MAESPFSTALLHPLNEVASLTVHPDGNLQPVALPSYRRTYEGRMQAIQAVFSENLQQMRAGVIGIAARAAAVDELVQRLWADFLTSEAALAKGMAIVAAGGYGRRELFPSSDVDLMFLIDAQVDERALKDAIRRMSQSLWDCGLRVSPMTRTLDECARFDPENVEFTLSLLDARYVAGAESLAVQLVEKVLPKLSRRDRNKCIARLLEITSARHARYGDTLFHLEPNVKECPGGLRDAHVCAWLTRLGSTAQTPAAEPPDDFREAREFLVLVRVFLHLRHGRDDNTLDWRTQDEAAATSLGAGSISSEAGVRSIDPALWMRLYFRNARLIERHTQHCIEKFSPARSKLAPSGIRGVQGGSAYAGFNIRHNRVSFKPSHDSKASLDADVVLGIFVAMAQTGAQLPRVAEVRLEEALPVLSAHLEDGPALWTHLQAILIGSFGGRALRAMHALGILELVIPEFHAIDALVIRDAFHRYTVDEHTFVVIDTLHALASKTSDGWGARFASVLRDLPHPELLYLAALLHDTGKGHAASGHALESARMAQFVLARLEIDSYESGLVIDLIRDHLEMSAALRRDVFDQETIRSFAARVPTPEALRMLTLFTYADIAAVHPDALTPWKAENLWRLYIATSNFLDRTVDDERVASVAAGELGEVMYRLHVLLPNRQIEAARFLGGFPRRYLLTRTPEQICAHIEMAARLDVESNQVELRYGSGMSEVTLITRDRPMLFASMAGALAAWGMNIVTADAFSNAHGLVVDSFRFADSFHTLELNESERYRFVASMRDVASGRANVETMIASRRRGPKAMPKVAVQSRIDFDDCASTQSTLLQVVAQDKPGLLRALSLTLAEQGCNIAVALIDTEGEMAIDVFYITRAGVKLEPDWQDALYRALMKAIAANAQ